MRSDPAGPRKDSLEEGSFQEPEFQEDPRFEELLAERQLREELFSGGRRRAAAMRGIPRYLALVQGSYYLATGLWPLIHMRSFELVTGPKRDRWLVRTVGVLAASTGAGLLQAGLGGQVSGPLRTVSLLSAVGFIAVEVPTARRGRISPIYLLDAVVESGFVVAGLLAAGRKRAP